MLNHDQGFTLVELMMTVAVVAIALSLGAPSMGEFIKNSRLVTQTNDLIASFHLARTEAIKRGARVTLCKSSDVDVIPDPDPPGPICDPAGDGRWGIGWITFVDPANVGFRDAGEVVIDARAATPLNVTIAPQATDPTSPQATDPESVQKYVSYTAQGIVRDKDDIAQDGTFRICDERGLSKGRGVVLSPTGRIELTTSIASCPS